MPRFDFHAIRTLSKSEKAFDAVLMNRDHLFNVIGEYGPVGATGTSRVAEGHSPHKGPKLSEEVGGFPEPSDAGGLGVIDLVAERGFGKPALN